MKETRIEHWKSIFKTELDKTIPSHVSLPHYLGGIAFLIFLIQVVTGVLLMVYYQPTALKAQETVRFITSDVRLGWMIRGLHRWGADLLVLLVFLHLLRTYFGGAYKSPREINWIIGVMLLFITLAFAFTGHPLVWDQNAYWSAFHLKELFKEIPIIGGLILDILWGGKDLTGATLLRFYDFHVGIFPWIMMPLLLIHLLLIWRQGIMEPASAAGSQGASYRFYPDFLLTLLIAFLFAMGILFTLSILFPPLLFGRADPLSPISEVRPVWYFLGLYHLLRSAGPALGALIVVLSILLCMAVPFIDRNPEIRMRRRPIAVALGIAAVAAVIVLSLSGQEGGMP